MKIAVITPYHEITDELLHCLKSVKEQDHPNFLHITVGDGCDLPQHLFHEKLLNIPLPVNIGDYGDSPRSIGVVYAKTMGADAVVFLDSDNWIAANHLSLLAGTANRHQSDIVACHRLLCHLDGSVLGLCEDSNGITFCDTNCVLVRQNLFQILSSAWLIPDELHAIGDRILWDKLIHATDRISISESATVFYRTAFEGHYRRFNIAPPQNAKSGKEIRQFETEMSTLIQRSFARMQSLGKI